MPGKTQQADIAPDRLITWAVSFIANDWELPRRLILHNKLTRKQDPVAMGAIGSHYRKQAWLKLKLHLESEFLEDDEEEGRDFEEYAKQWPLWWADAVTTGADYAYQVRAAAQGVRGRSPDPRVWSALVGAMTLIVVKAQIGEADPARVPLFVASLVASIEAL